MRGPPNVAPLFLSRDASRMATCLIAAIRIHGDPIQLSPLLKSDKVRLEGGSGDRCISSRRDRWRRATPTAWKALQRCYSKRYAMHGLGDGGRPLMQILTRRASSASGVAGQGQGSNGFARRRRRIYRSPTQKRGRGYQTARRHDQRSAFGDD